jgi:hypothetical protein
MKGIIIYGSPEGAITFCELINDASFDLRTITQDQIGQCGHYIWKVGEHRKVVSRLEGETSENSKAVCSPDDTYDFETGALIALMKMCGKEKALKAVEELYSLKEPRGADLDGDILESKVEHMAKKNAELLGENSRLNYIKSCNESTIESLENTRDLLINKNNELIAENEKLKLDCEKLQHGYNDMMFCGGRQNGKQFTFLVDLFKKTDQKKVDAAYKEAYKERLIWCSSQPSIRDSLDKLNEPISKLTVDSLIEESRAFTRKCVNEWLYKIPTKREEMWAEIFELHKESDVVIKVKKEDVNTFLHEIEKRIPEITWASSTKIFETKHTIDDIYEELKTYNMIYFRLWKENKLSYSSNPHVCPYRELKHIDYLPPMRWDLFKKGRLVVGVRKEHYDEFISNATKNIGTFLKHKPYDYNYTFFMYNKYSNFINSIGHSQFRQIKEMNNHKVIYWEDVR